MLCTMYLLLFTMEATELNWKMLKECKSSCMPNFRWDQQHFSYIFHRQLRNKWANRFFVFHVIQFNPKERENEKWFKSFMQIESRNSLYKTRCEKWTNVFMSMMWCGVVWRESETDSKIWKSVCVALYSDNSKQRKSISR